MPVKAHIVCLAGELPPGARKMVEIDGRSVGVFNVNGELYALRNVCPHRQAPLCLGPLAGLVTGDGPGKYSMARTGEILRCPWHGWEFDIRTGRSVFNPHGVRAKIYPVGYQADALGPQSCVGAGPPEAVETYPVAVEARQVVVYL